MIDLCAIELTLRLRTKAKVAQSLLPKIFALWMRLSEVQVHRTKLFFVWLGSSPTAAVMKTVSLWHNQPKLDIELITDNSETKNWLNSEILSGRHWAQVADVVRLSPFETYSGWYMDVDCNPGRSQLISFAKTTFFRTEPNLLANGIFFFRENPDFLECWKAEVLSGLTMRNLSVAECTGPGALTRAVYLYSIKQGLLKSSTDLNLAPFSLFLHWPAQFNSVLAWLPKFLREGQMATHYANASWAEPSERLKSGPTSLTRAILWKLRNSQVGPVFDYARFLLISKMPLLERLSKASLYASNRLTSQNVSEVTRLNDLVSCVSSQSELIAAVVNLKKAFIKYDGEVNLVALRNGGWHERQLKFIGKVWVRPSLSQILGGVPKQQHFQA
jgi:hypothetical protein